MSDTYGSILELIGNTPLVRINRLFNSRKVTIYAKLEMQNPGGSVKDRIALYMIEAAEKEGLLTPDKIIIEATSGNTGIGLAMVAAVKGYRITLAMPETASQERQKILKALGAEIMLTPGALGTDGAIEKVYELVRQYPQRYFMPDQFNNEANWQAHYHGTGREIWEQTKGEVSHVVVALGTTGTAMGVARRLKEYSDRVRVVAVEPYMGHKIQGLKNMKESYVPGIFDKTILDEVMHVEDEEAFETARKLAKEEGIFAGMSAGAAMAAAVRIAQRLQAGTIVAILPDGGERYLSTNLFTELLEPDIRLYNTITRQKEELKPQTEGKISIFTTGPSMSGAADLSECRRFVVTDLLRRYLEYKGFEVNQVINVSDMDERCLQGPPGSGEYGASHLLDKWLQAMDALGVKKASHYPRSSEHLEEMINMSRALLEKGYAYEKLRSVYFDISKFSDYGRLSRVDIRKVRLGMTVDLDAYEKINPRDFTLLRRATLAELKKGIYIKTSWGSVLPTLHLETVTLARKYLGETVDIHTSSLDFLFPHNENEIALAKAVSGKPLANYYLHCERVIFPQGKLAEESQHGTTVEQLLNKGFSGRQIRYWFLTTHYRKPLHFSEERLAEASRSLARLDEFLMRLQHTGPGEAAEEVDQLVYQVEQSLAEAMSEDLNTSSALAAVFRFIRAMNPLLTRGVVNEEQKSSAIGAMRRLDAILNIMRFEDLELDAESLELIAAREAARKKKNWQEADRLRQLLKEKGIELIDTPRGPQWRRTTPST
ncbi:MAG: cysteine synthase A [Deltaproteobacteria bacterium]|nr:cysteine synthase A [Deltaproteobacteria bacterium]MBW2071216.1 cysteine synthase A [Deltaproteobacteria bacterium]